MGKGIWSAALVALLPGALLALGDPPALAAEKTRVAIVDIDTPATQWHYEPNEVTVTAGSTVLWRNEGQQPHTVTSDNTPDNKPFNSSYLTHGQEWEWRFSAPGEYSYYCEPHPWMKGVLRVTAASGPSPTAPPAPQPPPAPPTTSAASTPKPTAAPATTITRAAATTGASAGSPPPPTAPAPAPTTTPGPAAPAPTTAPAEPAAVPATTSPPAVEDEAAAAPGGSSGGGRGNSDGEHNRMAIALASLATLGVTVISGKLLLSKPS